MLSRLYSGTVIGIEGVLIEVEVDVAMRGFPSFTIVGLPDKSVDEAKDRVRTAIVNSCFEMPEARITVNLAPADIKKMGAGFDLPIALGVLAAAGTINVDTFADSLFIGELSLKGEVRAVTGMISIVMMAKEKGIKKLFVPKKNSAEASLEGITVYPVEHLAEIVSHIHQVKLITPVIVNTLQLLEKNQIFEFDFAEVKGQDEAKRALQIAAAGFHNIHLKGVPGAGKTMLSRAFPSIQPPLFKEEMIEVSRIYSVTGLLPNHNFMTQRPFRSPHHTTSRIGLIGGGAVPVPGEISLAHRGVLFLDELPEFSHATLECLRQPMEDGLISICRVAGTVTFPSRFLLIAASNPCPCGYLGHPNKDCVCTSLAVNRYNKIISGPLLDRIDLHITILPVEQHKLQSIDVKSSSKDIKNIVCEAVEIQRTRFKNTPLRNNNALKSSDMKQFCCMNGEAESLIQQATVQLSLSARAYFKIIKVSRTIADLDKCAKIQTQHVAEALQYRLAELN